MGIFRGSIFQPRKGRTEVFLKLMSAKGNSGDGISQGADEKGDAGKGASPSAALVVAVRRRLRAPRSWRAPPPVVKGYPEEDLGRGRGRVEDFEPRR